jgi:hypothetical protein
MKDFGNDELGTLPKINEHAGPWMENSFFRYNACITFFSRSIVLDDILAIETTNISTFQVLKQTIGGGTFV